MTALFYTLIRLSLSASLVALAVMALRLIMKGRVPRAFLCGLWILVALRLLIPAFPESRISVVPQPVENGSFLEQVSENATEKTVTVKEEDPAFAEIVEYQKEAARPAAVREEGGTQYVVVSAETQQAPKTFGETVMPVLARVWAAGALLMLGYMAFSYGKIRRRVRQAVPAEENVWLCDGIRSSFILGLLKPRIYLPAGLQEEQPYALSHERSHLARGDQFWKPLGFLLLAVYWFNPVLWLSYVLLCRDIEAACDERVIRSQDGNYRKRYASALLNCSLPRGMAAACPLSFGGTDVKMRIRSVLKYRKPGALAVAAAVALSLIAAGCALTDPTADISGIQPPAGQEETTLPADTGAESTQPAAENRCDHSGYYTYVCIGADARDYNHALGDTVILVSISKDSYEVRMASVCRDFCVETESGLCRLTECYAHYGAEGTADVLGRNLDLDISGVLCVNWRSMAAVVDYMGGLDIEMTAVEAFLLNACLAETQAAAGLETQGAVPEEKGVYHCDGVQTVSFARIRQGDDAEQTGRQRKVIGLMLQKAKTMSLSALLKTVTEATQQVYTNINTVDIIQMATKVLNLHITNSSGFPFRQKTAEFIYADDLAENVKELHRFLYNETDYAPSENVRRIAEEHGTRTGN